MAAATALAFAACELTNDTASGIEPTGEVARSTTSSTFPPGTVVHTVVRGDTLAQITKAYCGTVEALPAIYAANVGRSQQDGNALVDIDLIEVGWELIIDCTVVDPVIEATTVPPGDDTTTTSPADTTTTTTEAPLGPLVLRRPPETQLDIAGPRPTSADVPAEEYLRSLSLSVSTLPSISIVPIEMAPGGLGETATLSWGGGLFIDTSAFGEPKPDVSLVHPDGYVSVSLMGELHFANAGIDMPPGSYEILAVGGGAAAKAFLEIVAPTDRVVFQRVSAPDDPPRFQIAGVPPGRLQAHIYVEEERPEDDAVYWVHYAETDGIEIDASGTGYLDVGLLGGAGAGTYCVFLPWVDEALRWQCERSTVVVP